MDQLHETPSNFRDGVQYAWDSTSLKAALTCLRYYKYKIIDGWQPVHERVHLRFGGHYATALEHYHKYRAQGMSLDDALIEVVHETLRDTWEIVGSKDGEPIGKPWQSFDTNKTRETLIRSIIWYIDTFANDSLETVILENGKPAAELSFTLEVDGGNLFCGHIDRLVQTGGDYFITDNKTTGSTITSRFFDQFNPDTQMSLYSFAGKAIYDIPVKGVVIDGAQIAVGFTRFERGFTFRTEDQLDEWYGETIAFIEHVQDMTLADMFPQNPTACGNYGGCEFRHICSKSPHVREQFLKGDFVKQKPWNPLLKR